MPSSTDIIIANATIVIAAAAIVQLLAVAYQAYVMKATLKASEDALKVVQKAWLSHDDIGYVDDHVIITVKNSGNTPAFPKTWGAKVYAIDDLQSIEVFASDLAVPSFGAINPGQVVTLHGPRFLPNMDHKQCLASRIVYVDAFGDERVTCDMWVYNAQLQTFLYAEADGANVAGYSEHS